MKRWSRTALLLVAAACGARGEPPPGELPAVDTGGPAPADTLVITAPAGVTVWLTEGRRAADSAGTACYERTIEIRRDTVRLKVPLLYTLSVPELLDDSTIRAQISFECRPGATYRIGLRDGMPHKVTQ